MQSQIRAMQPEDWPEVQRIYACGVLEGTSTFQTEIPDYPEWNRNHLADCRYVILADGTIAGWCAISPTNWREAYHGVVEVSIYLDPDYRRHGLGTLLLRYLCDESEKKGYWCLYSCIFSANEGSIRLHEECGFRIIGYRERIAKDRFGVWQNTTLLERRSKLI